MNSCLYHGRVRHRRNGAVEHAFDYRMFMLYLDLGELDDVFRGRWLWSVDRPNLACFLRRDYLGDPAMPLDDAVRARVAGHCGRRPAGPIRMLTHLRYWGYSLNPVTFYYCFDAEDREVEILVAEITNTPWNERHAYVLHAAGRGRSSSGPQRFAFDKAFHVSPFMDMDHRYNWRFSRPGESLAVHMKNFSAGVRCFDARLALKRRKLSGRSLAAALLRYPFMSGQVVAGIYWQALRLWWKNAPFYVHPSKRQPPLENIES